MKAPDPRYWTCYWKEYWKVNEQYKNLTSAGGENSRPR
jgi:hypothetical protein